jgi:hypothetical protein
MSATLSLGQPSGRTAVAIAGFIARPVASLRPAVIDRWLADVAGHDLRPMLAARAVQPVVNRYLAQATGAARLEVDAGFLARLRTRAGLGTAVEIALAPFARIDRLKAFVVGAICRDAVRGALLRSDRAALAALLGAEAQEFASRQAATFYPALGELAPTLGQALRAADGTAFALHPVSLAAGRVVAAALAAEAPLAAAILSIRETGAAGDLPSVAVTPAQGAEVLRLWQREAR